MSSKNSYDFLVDTNVAVIIIANNSVYAQKMIDSQLSIMCEKLPMSHDGIIRLSKVEVESEYLDEYIKFATEVGEISLRTEPGVLTMYTMQEKENPCNITILETYASQEAYRSHIASAHFQKYKQGTLHMVKNLQLLDQKVLNPNNYIVNHLKELINSHE